MDQQAFAAVARNKVVAIVVPAFERGLAVVETEAAFRLCRSVAAQAGRVQDGPDIAVEINLHIGGRWKIG